MSCLMDLVAPLEDALCEELLYVMGIVVLRPVSALAVKGLSATVAE